jgi:drug/metabolite transporter (DMT)-like permease
MVLVGSSVVAGKILTTELPVFLASALRFALALAVLLPLLRLREGGLPRLSRRSWGLLALQALFGSFLFTVFLLYGLRLTSPGAAGVITSATPACMAVFSRLLLRERLGARRTLGIACAVAGLLAVNGPGLSGNAGGTGGASELFAPGGALPGNLLVFGAVVAEALFLLIRKGVREPLSPLAAATAVSLFGLAWFALPAAWEAARLDWAGVSAAGWWAVVYYGLIVTVAAYLLWFAGIVRVDGAVAGAFTALMPVSAVGLSWLVLGLAPGASVLWGCAGILASIALMALGGRTKREPAGKDLDEKEREGASA